MADDEQTAKKQYRTVEGNVTITAETRYTPKGTELVEFNITTRDHTGKQFYLTCCCWDACVKAAASTLQHKGTPVKVYGDVSAYKKNDGSVKYTMNVRHIFVPSDLPFSHAAAPAAEQDAPAGSDNAAPSTSTEEEDDIPF